jgi:hypothetical protein
VTAMKYLSYLLYVLVIGYAIYSLNYDTHKSWYSWILNSLTGCIYTFGMSLHRALHVSILSYRRCFFIFTFRVRYDDAAAVYQLQA